MYWSIGIQEFATVAEDPIPAGTQFKIDNSIGRSVDDAFASALDEPARFDRLVELNVIEQVYNLGKTSIVQNAWKRGARPYIHGWVFDLNSGYVRPQTSMINNDAAMQEVCKFHKGIVGV